MRAPLIERTVHGNGTQRLYKFPNNYGASVVRHDFSYGGKKGLWELAVIEYTDDMVWCITYTTPITSDVEGRLTDDEVDALLTQIEALPPAKSMLPTPTTHQEGEQQ